MSTPVGRGGCAADHSGDGFLLGIRKEGETEEPRSACGDQRPLATTNANDNLTATELRGHSGKIIECDTCHTGTLTASLGGPHGIHPVGDRSQPGDNGYSQLWVNATRGLFNKNGLQTCTPCHGLQGQRTVLSTVAAQRTLRLGGPLNSQIILTPGEQVSCDLCHANPL